MQRGKSNLTEAKIYLDACILQGALGRKNSDDIIFLNRCKENGWKVYTSIHTLMELFDIARERAFLMKLVIKKWVDVSTFLRERRRMNLNRSELNEVADELNNFFITHKNIEFLDITEEVWNDVKRIVENSNSHSSDALHLALALMYQCDVLVTHDDFFIKEGNKLLKESKQYYSLRICDVPEVENALK